MMIKFKSIGPTPEKFVGCGLVVIGLALVILPAYYVARAVAEIVRGALRDFAEDGSHEKESPLHKGGRSTLRRSIRKQQHRVSSSQVSRDHEREGAADGLGREAETNESSNKSVSTADEGIIRREAAQRGSGTAEEEEEGDSAIKLTTNPILAQPDATGQAAGVDSSPSKPRPNLASVARAVRLAAALASTSDSPAPGGPPPSPAEGLAPTGEHVSDSSTQHWAQLRRQLALNKLNKK